MKTKTIESRRKLALRRETLRALDSLTAEQLIGVAGGGHATGTCEKTAISLSGGTKFC